MFEDDRSIEFFIIREKRKIYIYRVSQTKSAHQRFVIKSSDFLFLFSKKQRDSCSYTWTNLKHILMFLQTMLFFFPTPSHPLLFESIFSEKIRLEVLFVCFFLFSSFLFFNFFFRFSFLFYFFFFLDTTKCNIQFGKQLLFH